MPDPVSSIPINYAEVALPSGGCFCRLVDRKGSDLGKAVKRHGAVMEPPDHKTSVRTGGNVFFWIMPAPSIRSPHKKE